MDNLELARNCILFKDLEPMEFQALLRCLSVQIKTFKAGEIIEEEGNKAQYAYLVLEGECKTTNLDAEGNATPIHFYEKNQIFGLEYGRLGKNFYTEEFVANKDSILMGMNLFRLLTPCENRFPRHYSVISKCLDEYVRQISKTKERICELAKLKMRDKILLFLKNNIKKTDEFVEIPYNRQELADYLGVERSALSTQLAKLKKEGIIDYNRNKFKLFKKEKDTGYN